MPRPEEILEISLHSTPAQVRAAYRRLVLKWHPDRHGNSREAHERLLEIRRAYEVALTRSKLLYSKKTTRSARRGAPVTSYRGARRWRGPFSADVTSADVASADVASADVASADVTVEIIDDVMVFADQPKRLVSWRFDDELLFSPWVALAFFLALAVFGLILLV